MNSSVKINKQAILAIIGKYLDLHTHKVFFFGSRVTGKARFGSDMDIGILGTKPIPPASLAQIKDDLNENLPTLLFFDVVDFSQVSENFKKVAMQATEEIK